MKYKLVVFDMDGTILNTIDDLADTLNYSLGQFNMPKRSLKEVKSFVGNGIGKLIERAVPEGTTEEKCKEIFDVFAAYYKDHCADKTRPYDGIVEVIKELRNRGYKTAVVSNKADFAVKDLCEVYFKDLFDMSVGEKEGVRRKPYPDSVDEVLKALDIDRSEAVYVGDSEVDLQTAINSNMDVIMVEWGFRERDYIISCGAKFTIKEPAQILEHV